MQLSFRTQAVCIIACCALAYLPFCAKALHIDDPVTVYLAEQMSKNICNPQLDSYGEMLAPWNHTLLPSSSAFYITPHPPLVPAILSIVAGIADAQPWHYTLALFPFFIGAALFVFGLSRRLFPSRALEISLLFSLCPLVLVNSHSIMLDLPLTALTLGSFYFLFRSDRLSNVVIAGIFCGLACLTKFTGGTICIAALVYYLLKKQYRHAAIFIGGFAAIYGIWLIHNLIVWGVPQILANGHMRYIPGDIRYRFERLISYCGATIVFPLIPLLIAAFVKSLRWPMILMSAACGVWSFLMWKMLHYSIASALFYAICASAGILILYYTALYCFKNKDEQSPHKTALGVHFVLQCIGGLFLTLYASRYFLPAVFPALLGIVYIIEKIPVSKFRTQIWVLTILFSVIMSLWLSISDFQFAGSSQKIAQDLKKDFGGRTVHYAGRLGYLYYMNRAGFGNLIMNSDSVRAGDIVVDNKTTGDDNRYVGKVFDRLTMVRKYLYPVFGLRTIGDRAGFYGNDRLPYQWIGKNSVAEFWVYECN